MHQDAVDKQCYQKTLTTWRKPHEEMNNSEFSFFEKLQNELGQYNKQVSAILCIRYFLFLHACNHITFRSRKQRKVKRLVRMTQI